MEADNIVLFQGLVS